MPMVLPTPIIHTTRATIVLVAITNDEDKDHKDNEDKDHKDNEDSKEANDNVDA